jgi:hypothetical protein
MVACSATIHYTHLSYLSLDGATAHDLARPTPHRQTEQDARKCHFLARSALWFPIAVSTSAHLRSPGACKLIISRPVQLRTSCISVLECGHLSDAAGVQIITLLRLNGIGSRDPWSWSLYTLEIMHAGKHLVVQLRHLQSTPLTHANALILANYIPATKASARNPVINTDMRFTPRSRHTCPNAHRIATAPPQSRQYSMGWTAVYAPCTRDSL